MIELVFATNNLHKLNEISNLSGENFRILSLNDIGSSEDIPETADTLEGNASIKSWFIYNKYGKNCFADDTGLEVESLGGKPGVYSARYAGTEHDPEKNIIKLLDELKTQTNRKARFRTIISLIINGKEYFFEGIVNGSILQEKSGEKGFGYDPVFKPDGYDVSFAQMGIHDKNLISHRGKATRELIAFLKNFFIK
jgi:XTP/dITP diphosphohydrolase